MNGPVQLARMRSSVIGRSFASPVLGAIAALLSAAVGMAAPEGSPKKVSFSLSGGVGIAGPIRVISDALFTLGPSTGEPKWDRFKPGLEVAFEGDVRIEMKWPGKIRKFGIYFGQCSGHACFEQPGTPLMYSDSVSGASAINKHVIFQVPATKILATNTGVALSPHAQEIVAKCNAFLAQGGDIHKGHSFTAIVPITLGFDTFIGKQGLPQAVTGDPPFPLNDVDHKKTIDVSIPVICEPVPKVEKVQPPFELLAATLHGDPAEYAGACPVGIKLFMSAKSNIKGPFEARIESKTGWKSEKYVYQTIESNADGTWSKHFQDTLTVPVIMPVNQSSGGGAQDAAKGIGNVQMNPKSEEPIFPPGLPKGPKQVQTGFNPGNLHEDSLRLVVTANGKTITTDWWKYKVTCDPQKAKVADGAPSGVKQTVFVQQAFLALFPVAPKDGSKCGVTASGLVQTNVKNVNVTFRLKNHQGNTTNSQTIKTSHANNIGKFVEYLDFSTSGQGVWVTPGGGWALPGGGAGSQAGQKQGTLQIVVENPTTFEGNVANYNFTCYDPAPVGLQQVPTVKVDPAIPSIPGTVVGKGNDQTGQPDKQIAAPQIVCLGGTVRGGKCLCDGETVLIGGITSGARTTYRCEPKPREVAKPVIVTPQPKLVCTGGSVRNNACVCQRGYTPVKTGATSYHCRQVAILPPPVVTPKPVTPTRVTTPQIACAGGTVRSNKCLCPSGTTLQNGVCKTAATSVPLRSGATPQRVR